ncbi:MAG TPA: TadE/TadG family type IV pilus assembly protein [Alphaproteobacteria bacterium]|nr:TadE/TadG family type IV pilus assembly protein [Alphaproteobacteria bacterium]
MRCFLRSCSGGAAVELAMVFPLLLLLTFGIIEFGLVMNQVNMAEKATQIGARKAVTWDPVAPALATYTGISGSLGGGDPLPVGLQVDITCDSDGCTGAGAITSPGFSSTAFADIVDEMAAIYPAIEAENVVIEYHHVGLGFVGRPGGAVVPSVTVSLRDLTYDFILLDVAVTIASAGLVDINNLLYPSFSTTLTGEDLSDGA